MSKEAFKQAHTQNRAIIRRYTDQPARLPRDLRQRLEADWGGEPVQLYALADLDARMRLTEAWLALGPSHVALARQSGDGEWEVDHVPRRRIDAVRDAPGLSGSVLTLLGEPDEPALLRVRFTHRQRRAMENIKFVLEHRSLEARSREDPSPGGLPSGRETGTATSEAIADAFDADVEYARSVAAPIREAQALVAGM